MAFGDYLQGIDQIKTASEASTVSDAAIELSEQKQAAVLINLASQCGDHEALWQRPMTDDLKTWLEGKGYTVYPLRKTAVPGDLWTIEW